MIETIATMLKHAVKKLLSAWRRSSYTSYSNTQPSDIETTEPRPNGNGCSCICNVSIGELIGSNPKRNKRKSSKVKSTRKRKTDEAE